MSGREICDKPMNPGTLDGEAVVCGKEPGHGGDCGDWTGSTSRDGDTITVVPELPDVGVGVEVGVHPDPGPPDLGETLPFTIPQRNRLISISESADIEVGAGFPNLFARMEATIRAFEAGDRFSEDLLGADGKAFIAVAMETTESKVECQPFAATITIEASRSRLVLSFDDPLAALAFATNLSTKLVQYLSTDGPKPI